MALAVLGATVRPRLSPTGASFVTGGGHRAPDRQFGPIVDPARLEERIGRVVVVLETGLPWHES